MNGKRALFDLACDLAWKKISQDIESVAQPVGIVLGGQPGAGKSNAIAKLDDTVKFQSIIINADEFRYLHPKFDEIQAKYGREAPLHTGEFAGCVASEMLHRAIEGRFHVVIEGTFRTVETPLNTLKLFKENGYQTQVHIVTTAKSVSWQSTIERGQIAEALGEVPRYVDKGIHDFIVSVLGKNADIVFETHLADRFVVHSRETVLFDSEKDLGLPGKMIYEELNRN